MPINKIEDPTDLEKDLLKATIYVLVKNGRDVKNAFNIVRLLSRQFHFEDLEWEVMRCARQLEGMQEPDISRLVSPDRVRRNEFGNNPYYIRMPGLTSQAALKPQTQEERDIAEFQYDEPEHLPPRMDLRKRRVQETDPDVDEDPDMKNATSPYPPEPPREFTYPPREYTRFIMQGDTEDPKVKIAYHDLYSVEGQPAKQAGVLYCTFTGKASGEARAQLAMDHAKKVLQADVQKHQGVKLLLNYWQLPHKIASLVWGFNNVMADPDEWAVSYAIIAD